ncbi:MAG TPA: S8 family serine peptidase [Verrucomicrobiae bacterium]|nr:S8 family serine peptidase [Verrucomicrobiae bacterium]
MKKIGFAFGTLALVFGLLNPGWSQDQIPGQIYVSFKPNRVTLETDTSGFMVCHIDYLDSVNLANELQAIFNVNCGDCPLLENDYIAVFPDSADIPDLVDAYLADTNVIWAGARYFPVFDFTPNDSFFAKPSPSATPSSYQWPLDSAHLQMEKAWDITKGDTGVVIAILDSWHAWRHPDLETTAWLNYGEDRNGNGQFDPEPYPTGDLDSVDNDNDGYIDNMLGYHFDAVDSNNELVICNPNPEPILNSQWDSNLVPQYPHLQPFKHGTWTWGTVAAKTHNYRGVAGAGFNCRVLPVGFDNYAPVGPAFCYLLQMKLQHGIPHIVNMSFRVTPATPNDTVLVDSLYGLGVVLIGAAGNDFGREVANFPAGRPKVISVAATDSNDYRAHFSTIDTTVDLSAPGFNYMTQIDFDIDSNKVVGYGYASVDSSYTPPYFIKGTSFSAPLVAGVAGLVRSLFPSWSVDEIMAKIRSSTDSIQYHSQADRDSLAGKFGTGRLNAYKAVTFFGNIPNSANDTTLDGVVYVSGDITVPAGKTLTLTAGTSLKFVSGDVMPSTGNPSPGKGQLIVKGTLTCLGSVSDSIILTSFQSSPQAGTGPGF